MRRSSNTAGGGDFWDVGVNVTNFKVVAKASFDASDPGRPRLVSATLQPKLSVGRSGVLPSSIPVTFTVTYDARAGTATLRGKFSFSLKGAEAVGARLSGSVLIVLRPTQGGDHR